MKMSYKIALITAVVVFALAMFVFSGSSESDKPANDSTPVADQSEPPARKSLVSDPPQAGATSSQANSQPAEAATDQTNPSLAQDVRSRLRAVDSPTVQTPEAKSEQFALNQTHATATPDALALTRTDATSPASTQAVSSQQLDAILGNLSKSADSTSSPTLADAPGSATASDSAGVIASNAQRDTTYVVQPGDTFSSIAEKHYGNESHWFDIAQSNPTIDPTRLRVGQELRLPAILAIPLRDEVIPPGPEGVKSYTIRPGDSLSTVAEKFYGDPTLWRTIYNFNRDKIGANPNAIQAGMVVKVPPRPAGAR